MRMKIPLGFKVEAYKCALIGIDRSKNKYFYRNVPFVICRFDTNLERDQEKFNKALLEMKKRSFTVMQVDPKCVKDDEIDVAFVGSDKDSMRAAHDFVEQLSRNVLRIVALYGVSDYHFFMTDSNLFDTDLETHVTFRRIDNEQFTADCLYYIRLFLDRRDSDLFLIGVVNVAAAYLDSHLQAILDKFDNKMQSVDGIRRKNQEGGLNALIKGQPEHGKINMLIDNVRKIRDLYIHRKVMVLSSQLYSLEARENNRYNQTTSNKLKSAKHPVHKYDYKTVKRIIKDAKRAVGLLERVYDRAKAAGM